MSAVGKSSFHVRQCILIVGGLLVFFIAFWPMPGFGHPAGEFYHKALEAIQDKNLQQAESLLEQAIKEFPSYAEAHHLLGLVQYQRTQDAHTAIPALQQAVKLNPNFAQAHYDLGLLFLNQEKMEEAQQAIQQTLTLYPGFWEARLTLAKTFDQTGATDNAIQEYGTVLKQEPLASEALFHLAYHLIGLRSTVSPGVSFDAKKSTRSCPRSPHPPDHTGFTTRGRLVSTRAPLRTESGSRASH
jgi:tetratricopeptide (TPR) repeat protein